MGFLLTSLNSSLLEANAPQTVIETGKREVKVPLFLVEIRMRAQSF